MDLVGVEPTPLGLKTRLAPTRPGPWCATDEVRHDWIMTLPAPHFTTAQPASDHWIGPRPGNPSAAAVAPVRSHSRPAMYGPLSITGTVMLRPA